MSHGPYAYSGLPGVPGRSAATLPAEQRPAVLTRRMLAGLGLGGALAGACQPGQRGGAGEQPRELKPVTLVWQIRGGPGGNYEKLATDAMQQFRQKNPHITVEFVFDAGNVEKTLTMMVAGTGPDVFHGWGHVMWQYAAKEQMINHNEIVRDFKKADLDDFMKWQWDGFVIPTTTFRFGLPTYVNMMVLYWNRDHFRQLGQAEPTVDWGHDEYAAMARRLTRREGDKQIYGAWIPMTAFDRFQNHVLMFGGHVVDPKDLTKTLLHEPPAQTALEWMRARQWDDRTFLPIRSDLRPLPDKNQWDHFYLGHVSTLEDGMHNLRGVAQNMTMDWDIAHVPKGPVRRAVLGTTDGWAIWSGTKAREAAVELLKFITSVDYYKMQATYELLIPSRKSVLDHWITTAREQFPVLQKVNLKVVKEALVDMGYPTPDEIFLCQAEAAQVIGPALNQLYRDGTATPRIFQDIKDQINQAAGSCGVRFK